MLSADPTGSTLGITLVYVILGGGVAVLLGSLGIPLRGLVRALRPRARGEQGEHVPVLRGTVAASAGLASVVGAALAVDLGGPGALPWMWVVTFLGIALFWAEVLVAAGTRVRDSQGALEASPIHALRLGLGGTGAALGALYGLLFALAALGIGALLHGQQVGALVGAALGVRPPVVAGLFALLVAPLLLAPRGWLPGIRRRCLQALPLLVAIYVVITVVALLRESAAAGVALEGAVAAAFSGEAALGGLSGGIVAALTHAVLWTTMTGPGLGVAAFAPEVARVRSPEDAATRAMLGPVVGAGIVGSLTALTLLTYAPGPAPVVAEPAVVHLGTPQSRALLESARGPSLVLPEAGESPLEVGTKYALVLRADPRGHRVGKVLMEENAVVLPHWGIATTADTVRLRERTPERRDNPGYDLVIPCAREVVDTSAGPFLKLTPRDPEVDLVALLRSRTRNLDGPYVVLGDLEVVGAVERAFNPEPKFGEHLALYEITAGRPYNPTMAAAFALGFRGPYVAVDEEPLPPALVGVAGFLPELGGVVRLRLEAPKRGLDLGLTVRGGVIEGPGWPFLAGTQAVILRHREDPRRDLEIPVVARWAAGRLRFSSAVPGFSFSDLQGMISHEGPYLAPPPVEFLAEVHGDARLPSHYRGRRALIPVAMTSGEPLPDLAALLRGGFRGPTVAADGAGALGHVLRRSGGEVVAGLAACVLFGLGLVGAWAWVLAGAASFRQVFGAGAGGVYRVIFVGLCAASGALTLAEVLRVSGLWVVLAAEVQVIGLLAVLPGVLRRRTRSAG